MVNCVDVIGDALQAVLDACEQALIDCERPAGLVHLAPGASVAWDNCCEGGGQLWVRVVTVIPQPVQSQGCDIDSNLVRIGVGVIRCAHVLDDDGNPPSAAEMSADTRSTTTDAHALQNAIRCLEWPKTVYPKTVKFESGTPLGPQGGCAGWEWTLTYRQGICGCES